MGTDVKHCALCEAKVEDLRSSVECCMCQNIYHDKCVRVDLRGFYKKKPMWKCDMCHKISASAVDQECADTEDRSVADSQRSKLYEMLLNTMSRMDEKITSLNRKIDMLIIDNKTLRSVIHSLKSVNNDWEKPLIADNPQVTLPEVPPVSKPIVTYSSAANSTVLDPYNSKKVPAETEKAKILEHSSRKSVIFKVPHHEKTSLLEPAVNPGDKQIINKDFKLVTRKNKIVRGTKKSSSLLIKSAERQSYVYVGNLHIETTPEVLSNYLVDQFPSEKFTIEQLPKRDSAKSVAFKVGVRSSLYESLMDESLWAIDIIVKKKYFFREKEKDKIMQ